MTIISALTHAKATFQARTLETILTEGRDMTEKPMIGGIVTTAPLWNGATEDDMRAIVKALSDASHHFADDSGKECGSARHSLDMAAATVNRLRLGFYAIQCLHRDQSQLVALDQFMDAILKDARS